MTIPSPDPVKLRTQINLVFIGMIIMKRKQNVKAKQKSLKPKKASQKKEVNFDKRPKR